MKKNRRGKSEKQKTPEAQTESKRREKREERNEERRRRKGNHHKGLCSAEEARAQGWWKGRRKA
jgi:hypothetical protein